MYPKGHNKTPEALIIKRFRGCNIYSSSSRLTTCSVTRFAVLQDIGVILSGIEENNHIFSVFLSQNYPWDNICIYR